MKNYFSRREFVCTGALAGTALVTTPGAFALSRKVLLPDDSAPFRLGLASYTFRNFTRAQLIGFMKQLNVLDLNAKDVKDQPPARSRGRNCGSRGLQRCRNQTSRRRHSLFHEE